MRPVKRFPDRSDHDADACAAAATAATQPRTGRRQLLIASAVTVLGMPRLSPLRSAAAAGTDTGFLEFMSLSYLLTGRNNLDPNFRHTILAALISDDAGFVGRLTQLAAWLKAYPPEAQKLAPILASEQPALAQLAQLVPSAWYLGIVGSGAKARAIAYETTLMYAHVAISLSRNPLHATANRTKIARPAAATTTVYRSARSTRNITAVLPFARRKRRARSCLSMPWSTIVSSTMRLTGSLPCATRRLRASQCVSGKLFVLAANAIEPPKLMLMSATTRHPHGIGNSSDMVGRNLMDHPTTGLNSLSAEPMWPGRGPMRATSFNNLRDGEFRSERAAFKINISNAGPFRAITDMLIKQGESGTELDRKIRDWSARWVSIRSYFEMLPDPANRIALSPDKVDKLALSRPEVYYKLVPYVDNAAPIARDHCTKIAQLFNGSNLTYDDHYSNYSNHIMGRDPADSVMDRGLHSHDHPNLLSSAPV